MEEGIKQVLEAALVLLIIVVVAFAFSPRLYASVKPFLGLNASNIIEQDKENIRAFDSLLNLYTSCSSSKKTNCYCKGEKLDNWKGQLIITQTDNGIRLYIDDDGKFSHLRTLENTNHCLLDAYFYSNKIESSAAASLYIDKNDRIIDKGREFLGDYDNPITLYKWNKDGTDYLCIASTKFMAQQILNKEILETSCF